MLCSNAVLGNGTRHKAIVMSGDGVGPRRLASAPRGRSSFPPQIEATHDETSTRAVDLVRGLCCPRKANHVGGVSFNAAKPRFRARNGIRGHIFGADIDTGEW